MKEYTEITDIIKEKLLKFKSENEPFEYGIVLQVGDGISRIYGLNNAFYGELIEFSNSGLKGMVFNIEEDYINVVIFGLSEFIKEGDIVKRIGKMCTIEVGEKILGRVVNTLGIPIDGKGSIKGPFIEMPLERKAPCVIFRQPVNEPLYTGIKIIDSMIPIGCGQRELIIGDRKTGKTTVAIDTIINQKVSYDKGDPIYCIYVAINQKGSTISSILNILDIYGALPYTVIVSANASDATIMQVFAPLTGTAIGEYFRDTGRKALIIYDDLSKHAIAYREISLLLRRYPGREAYPGDIFYLHSRLLERSAKIINNDLIASKMNNLPKSLKKYVKGGGSLTSLPIIETQYGDVSSYIPTNVISITDGQIFLEKDLFNSGIRPAINESLSVSRVGSSAQIKSMKKVSSTLKLYQSQYKELEIFAKLGYDMDKSTIEIINNGKRNVEILKQKAFSPYKISYQIAILYIITKNLLQKVPIKDIKFFEEEYLLILKEKYSNVLESLEKDIFDKKITNILEMVALELITKYQNINQ
ncbi:MAG: F0F1 ATP synthase subunit alpha [Candidatus Bostrichicola ureolyticus]|nr:MAG: F0F1 ATP synthase subunit alpha [Candidatus Bostrichicola ureolyticus]